jgi:hypothetical protein
MDCSACRGISAFPVVLVRSQNLKQTKAQAKASLTGSVLPSSSMSFGVVEHCKSDGGVEFCNLS